MSILLLNKRRKTISTNSDPYWNNVVLYLKGDGVNNSTTIVDSSPSPKTITIFGDTKISTTQSKYGGSSIYFDGNGDYLTALLNINATVFTVETWVWLTANNLTSLFSGETYGNTDLAIGNNEIRVGRKNVAWDITIGQTTAINQWHHLAFCRNNGILKIFFNGSSVYSNNYNANLIIGNATIGCVKDGTNPVRFLTGYLDCTRFTIGNSRYSANFNPETDTYLAY